MNKLIITIVFSIISILFSCKQKDINKESVTFQLESEIDTSLNHSLLPIYEIDTLLFDELKYILKEDKKNNCYDSLNVGYSFYVLNRENNGKVFLITSQNMKEYDFSNCKGIFVFNEIWFVYSGISCDEILWETEGTEYISYYRKLATIDDSKSSWTYLFVDNSATLLEELSCGKLKNQNIQLLTN